MPDTPPSAPTAAPSSESVYASIDVGTNSVKLVVADLAAPGGRRLYEESLYTRLGEGMQAHGNRLREVPMLRTLDAIAAFVTVAKEQGARDIAAVGTAALRDAENRADFLERVRTRCGLAIDVIPGEEEARLSYLAVRLDSRWQEASRLTVIEIGGGSMQVTQGAEGREEIASRISVNQGAVRLTEAYLKSDPPTVAQLAAANAAGADVVAPLTIEPDGEKKPTVVGVGGTMTNLAAMNLGAFQEPDALHGYVLTADDLENQMQRLASATIAERQQMPGLDPRRADIILGGAILLTHALAHFGSASIHISTRGLRWGLLYDRFL